MGGKWLEKLKEIAPRLTRVALIFNPATTPYIAAGFYLRAAEDAAQAAADGRAEHVKRCGTRTRKGNAATKYLQGARFVLCRYHFGTDLIFLCSVLVPRKSFFCPVFGTKSRRRRFGPHGASYYRRRPFDPTARGDTP
jgi:hypothetical protein